MPSMNRHLISGRVRYIMFCNDPCYEIHNTGYCYLLQSGFHPEHNPWIEDFQEENLLDRGYLRCISTPTFEARYDQLNYEYLYICILG